tara:strand:- start:1362 stop:2033 length:672 start_codon:yes stop_codon:yes gene_type:complete
VVSLKDVVLVTVQIEEKHGFVGRSGAETGLVPTKERVKKFFELHIHDDLTNCTTEHHSKADSIIKYIQSELDNVDPLDKMYNYYNDLRTIYREDVVNVSSVGLISSALGLYNQHTTRKDFMERVKDSAHQGLIGDRGLWFNKLLSFREMHNDFGGFQYKVLSREGNYGVFYSQKDFGLEIGDCFLFKGTVKDHKIHSQNNIQYAETQWNRVVFVENYGKPDAR